MELKQKFRKLTFVKVADKMPSSMSHFDKGFEGIVEGTYSQLYGGDKIDKYCLFVIKDDKIVNRIAWYYESQLTALEEQDSLKAEVMIENYNLKRQ